MNEKKDQLKNCLNDVHLEEEEEEEKTKTSKLAYVGSNNWKERGELATWSGSKGKNGE